MLRSRRVVPALLLALVLAGCDEDAPPTVAYAWQGNIGSAGWLRIRNQDGRVEVRRSPDARVTVGATVSTGGRTPTWVRDSSAEGVTLCVTFDGGRDCSHLGANGHGFDLLRWVRARLGGHGGTRSVKYVVYVPADAGIDVETMNGGVDLQSVVREARVRTTNGGIKASAVVAGFDARAVNGSVDVALDLTGDRPVSIETVNGSVTAELPASLAGDVALATVNGRLSSDFALATEGRTSMRGTLGGGGRTVSLRTVNGSVRLRRRG